MQVSVETTEGLQRKMTVQVPSDEIQKEVQSRLQHLSRSVRLDGFRPGKVPFGVVKQRFGGQVYQEVVGGVIEKTYGEAIAKQELRPAGYPSIEPGQVEDGKDFEYIATFDVYPEFEVAGVEKLKIEKPTAEVTDEDLDKMIDNLRKQRVTYKDCKRAAKKDDKVIIDFLGTVDGEEFEGGKAEDYPVVVGGGQMIEDFDKALKGMKAGEEKEADVNFPEDYPAENLKGKTAVFKITVKNVSAPKLPEVDEEFIKQFGVEDGDAEKFKSEIRANMDRELSQAVKAATKQQVMDGLVEANEVDLPNALVDEEINALREQAKQRMAQYGAAADNAPELPANLFEEDARKRVKLGLILGELIKVNELKLDKDKVDESLKEMAATYEKPEEVIRFYRQNAKMMENINAAVMEQQVVDWVLEKAKVTEKAASFEELTGQQQA